MPSATNGNDYNQLIQMGIWNAIEKNELRAGEFPALAPLPLLVFLNLEIKKAPTIKFHLVPKLV